VVEGNDKPARTPKAHLGTTPISQPPLDVVGKISPNELHRLGALS
jgi:hypothetical protein